MYDFLVIGGGSGGIRASRLAASFGAKVGIIEKDKLGGTCVNLGCVPKKLFMYASEFANLKKIAAGYGWSINADFNWQTLIKNKNQEIQKLNQIYEETLTKFKVDIIRGKAEILAKNKVQVNGRIYYSKKLLLATGSYPSLHQIDGIEHAVVSDDLFYLEQLPKSIAIVGAGYIAIEFAGIFCSLGVKTFLIHRNQTLLKNFDQDVVKHLIFEVKQKGVNFCLEQTIKRIETNGEHKIIHLSSGEKKSVDLVFYATGRQPNLIGMNLDKLGIKLAQNGGIEVNEFFQTSNKDIYAVGDVIDHINLTPVAIKQAIVVANYLFNNKKIPLDYEYIPTAIFSQPNLASVGYTEAEAKDKFEIEVYKTLVTPLKYSIANYKEKALLKLIVVKKTQKIIGVHMVGPSAGEVIQIFAVALRAGCTKEDLDKTVGLHPSLAEEWVTMQLTP